MGIREEESRLTDRELTEQIIEYYEHITTYDLTGGPSQDGLLRVLKSAKDTFRASPAMPSLGDQKEKEYVAVPKTRHEIQCHDCQEVVDTIVEIREGSIWIKADRIGRRIKQEHLSYYDALFYVYCPNCADKRGM